MALFRSANQARVRKKEIKQKISEILDFDLQDVEKSERTLSLWFSTVGQSMKHSLRKMELETLEKDLMDAEAYLLFAKSTSLSKEIFQD